MKMFRDVLGRQIAFLTFAVLLSAPTRADDVAEVNALLQTKQFDAALAKAMAYLAKNPRDPQMRFLQGVSLTSTGKQEEAFKVFTALATEYPALAEPHNNLAVLYASVGQYDEARIALENAVRANPDYVAAYENLGDLHVQLAKRAYGKALQLDPGSSNAKQWQALLTAPGRPVASQVPPAAASGASDHEAVLAATREWARAWSARDVAAYLDCYGPEFRTPHQEPRPAWEASRRAMIANKTNIAINIESPQVSLNGEHATVQFRQRYVSDKLSSTENKSLVLRRYSDGWKIVQERRGK